LREEGGPFEGSLRKLPIEEQPLVLKGEKERFKKRTRGWGPCD